MLAHGEGGAYRLEKRYFAKSGDLVWAYVAVSPVPDADGNQAADLVVDGTGGVLKSANGADNPATPDSNYLDGVAVSAGSVAFVIDSRSGFATALTTDTR